MLYVSLMLMLRSSFLVDCVFVVVVHVEAVAVVLVVAVLAVAVDDAVVVFCLLLMLCFVCCWEYVCFVLMFF